MDLDLSVRGYSDAQKETCEGQLMQMEHELFLSMDAAWKIYGRCPGWQYGRPSSPGNPTTS